MSLIPTTLLALFCLVAPVAAQGGKPAAKPAGQEPEKQEEPKKAQDKEKSGDKAKGDVKKTDGTQDGKAAEKVDFASQVLPILEKNCAECHATATTTADGKKKRPKGGVTLDSKDGIEKSKKGKLVIGKKPDESMLVHSISLPADDEDRMPPAKKGDKLPDADIALIKKWIEEGADFGNWKGGGKKADAQPEDKGDGKSGGKSDDKSDKGDKSGDGKKKRDQSLGLGLAPLSDEALSALRRNFAVEPVDAKTALVRVSCYGREAQVDDEALTALLGAVDHVGELVLARTQVTDTGMATVAQLPNLTHLDLRGTKVGDAGARALAALSHLASINLLGTAVGDEGLAALAACTELAQVYVWQTPVTAQAVVAFRERVPAARVVFAADLPEPMAEAPVGGRSRRR